MRLYFSERRILFLLIFCITADTSLSQSCDSNAVCVATESGFNCTCNAGYEGTSNGCVNIDECVTLSPCKLDENCTDTDGNYTCHCGDIGNVCDELADCVSNTCTCKAGYTGSGVTCTDLDECATSGMCGDNADCSNTVGSYTCTCRSGYTKNGDECIDINECVTGSHNCTSPLTCSNTEGTFQCTCGNDKSCPVNAKCIASETNSSCVCDDGYQGNEVQCTDIDECNDDSNACNLNANCINTVGNYTCECKQGFDGDGLHQCDGVTAMTISLSLLMLVLLSVWKNL